MFVYLCIQSSSGVGVNQECLDAYQDLKLRKKYKFIVYTLNNTNTEIVVEKTHPVERISENASTNPEAFDLKTVKDYELFLQHLPSDECRYAIYDFEFKTKEGTRTKIAFFSWYVPLIQCVLSPAPLTHRWRIFR